MKELKDFKAENYYTPYKNNLLIKWETNESQNGVIIPEALRVQKIGLEVIAIGKEVTDIKPGDYVVPSPAVQIGVFKLFDSEYAQIPDYNVFAVVSKDYDKDLKEFKRIKEELDKEKVDLIK